MEKLTLRQLLEKTVDNSDYNVSNSDGYDLITVYKKNVQVNPEDYLDAVVIEYNVDYAEAEDGLADSWIELIVTIE